MTKANESAKRDGWVVWLSLLIIPGAGMELYDSMHKLLNEAQLIRPWDYIKYFCLAVAATAAVIDLRNRLVLVLNTLILGPFIIFPMLFLIFGGLTVLGRGVFGYGWGGISYVGIALGILVVAGWLAVGTSEQEEREQKARDEEILERDGPEGLDKHRSERSAVANGMARAAREKASLERRFPH